jgi:hypothetical protein
VVGLFKQPVSLILLVLFLYPIIVGYIYKFSSQHLKGSIQGVFQSISFLISLCLGIYYTKKVFIAHNEGIYQIIYNNVPMNIIEFINSKPLVVYVLVMPLVILIIYSLINFVVNLISQITVYPLLDRIESSLRNKSVFFKRLMGAIFQVPRSICYVIVITFIMNFLSLINVTDMYNKYLQESQIYSYISKEVVIPLTNSSIAKQLPNVVNNSFRIVVKDAATSKPSSQPSSQNTPKGIIYYNGVTLDQGVKSNEEINKFAVNLVQGESTTKDKARTIYKWVGSKVSYSDEKANRVLNNDLEVKSGAIPTFNSRSGICFDYACLYVAMCRANNIKVRIITGQGFNGSNWVSHAWNQVYVESDNTWINVDPTFLIGGDYFNSERFNIDHKQESVAGEW